MSATVRPAADLDRALHDVLGSDLTREADSHTIDGAAPGLIATPRSEEDVAATLAKANESAAAVVPWGAGLHQGYGNALSRYDVALDTTSLSTLAEYEPADLTITTGAGMTLGELQQTLDANGQLWPIDGPAHATLGGLVAVAHAGPSQHAYGPLRDWVLGCRLALANGDVVRAGGRVVKNVAGYDLTRMAAGSLGTLGVLTELTLKIAPQPAKQETILVACATPEAALTLAREIEIQHLALRAITLVENQVACWLAGSTAAVDRTQTAIRELTRESEVKDLRGEAADRWWAALDLLDATADVTVRVSVPPSQVMGTMKELTLVAEDLGVSLKRVAYPTVGIIIGRLKDGDAAAYVQLTNEARQAIVDMGGSLVVTNAAAGVKALVDPWGDVPGLDVMRSLKHEFDPTNTLNAGRFVGGL